MKNSGKLGLLALLGLLASASLAPAQDTIGVVAEAIKPEVADKLKLTEEQRTKMRELLNRRQSDLIELSRQLRETPPDQKQVKRVEFREETERMAYALLDVEQRGMLEHIRIDRMGLLSLAEPTIAKVLNLADWQSAKVAELVAKANSASRSPDADKVRADVERSIRSEISESQWATWQVLAGRSSGTDIGNPMPPERKQPATTVAMQAGGQAAGGARGNAAGLTPDRMPVADVRLQMNFQSMPWADVLKWLCDQADLSLQADTMPPGSFTYRDNSRKYSVGEALDIMSAALLGNGYSLVRRDRLLMVVDLEAPMVKNFIKELADFVPLEKLDTRGDFELVKCQFLVSRMSPDDAKKEVEQLLSLQGSVVSLPSAGQIQVTDTAGVMRAVRALIQRAEDPESMRGSSIVAITLKHITSNEVLDVARPLLGLPEGTNSNQDISLSSDTFGNTLFVNAKKTEDVQKLRDLVQHLDVAPSAEAQGIGQREVADFRTHEIVGSDAELAFRVISQRFAGEPEINMELDKETNKLVVRARPSVHKEIDDMIRMLGGQSSSFEVLELKNLDVQVAIATIKKFMGLSDSGSTEGQPIIDGDLILRRLYIKASPQQMTQIRSIIDNLEKNTTNTDLGGNVRVIPLPSRKVDQTLERLTQLWQARRMTNRLRVVQPGSFTGESSLPQRTLNADEPSRLNGTRGSDRPSNEPGAVNDRDNRGDTRGDNRGDARGDNRGDSRGKRPAAEVQPPANEPRPKTSLRDRGQATRFVSTIISGQADEKSQADEKGQTDEKDGEGIPPTEKDNKRPGKGDDIVIMPGPGGLIVTSGDAEALAEFDKLLQMLLQQTSVGSAEPTFFYLKYRKAAAAKELLEAILSGTTSSSGSGGGGGLIGDMVSEVGGGLIGSLLGGGGGGIAASGASMTTGDVIINADPQLNILVIRANAVDLEFCEQLLRIIDQPDSPIAVQTRGQRAVIPVLSQDANDVAQIVKGLYGDRIEGGGGGGGGAQRAPDPREFIQALTGGGGRGGRGANSQLAEIKIAITVDKKTNSLVVMGPPQDLEDIRALVADLDMAGEAEEEGVVVASLSGTNLNVGMIDSALKSVLGPKARTNTNSSQSGGSSSNSQSSQSSGGDADQARRAAEAIQQFRERMMQGGGNRGGFPGGGTGGGFTPGGGFFRGFGGGGTPGGGGNQGGRGGGR